MRKRLILFNGPPYSGKDTAANFVIAQYPNSRAFKLSAPLKAAVPAFFNLTDAEMRWLEGNKGEKTPLLFGHTYRDVQISLSEEWAKEKFGIRVFGYLAKRAIQHSPSSLFVCSDSGFSYEAEPLLPLFAGDDVLIIRIHRPGHTFAGDSRGYIEMPGITTLDIYNAGDIQLFHQQLKQVLDAWLTR